MRRLLSRTLVGGLMLRLDNESCQQVAVIGGGGSLSMVHAASVTYSRSVPPLELVSGVGHCDGRVYGLLPLLASRSMGDVVGVEHVVYGGGSGEGWARGVRGSAWSVPCALTGRSADVCRSAGFSERVSVWCEVNAYIRREALLSLKASGGGVYRVVGGEGGGGRGTATRNRYRGEEGVGFAVDSSIVR